MRQKVADQILAAIQNVDVTAKDQAIGLMKQSFDACIDTQKLDTDRAKPLLNLLSRPELAWPLLLDKPWTPPDENEFSELDVPKA